MLSVSDIRANRSVVDDLRIIPFEFDLVDYDSDDSWIAFDPEFDFEIVAGDYCGGVYILYEHGAKNRGVFHVSSEAKASRIGDNLRQALEHILTMPYCYDAGNEDLNTMRDRIADFRDSIDTDWQAIRDRVGRSLGLNVAEDYVERLHHALAVGVEMHVRVNGNPTINGFSNNWHEL